MKSKSLIVLFFIFFPLASCFALDWKALHEKADSIDPEAAVAVVQTKPGLIEDLYVLTLVYLNEHKNKEALTLFEKIQSLEPSVTEASWGIAEILRRQHNLDKSEKLLQELINKKSDFAPAYISLAYDKYIKMDFNKAVILAHTVLDMGREKVDTSNYVRAYLIMGGCKGMIAHYGGPLSKVINGTSVLTTLKKAEALQPNAAEVLFGIGSYYLLAPPFAGGDKDKALDYLERAVKADPLLVDAYVRLAQAYKLKGDDQKFSTLLQKALEIDPANELALDIKNKICKFICVDRQ